MSDDELRTTLEQQNQLMRQMYGQIMHLTNLVTVLTRAMAVAISQRHMSAEEAGGMIERDMAKESESTIAEMDATFRRIFGRGPDGA